MKIQASVPILTLNAKEHLQKLLPKLIEQFEDVLIIDGNSTDGTQEYARSLGVRVERQASSDEPNLRITDFTTARLHSWSFAQHDWIFLIDADEQPTEGLIELVRSIVSSSPSKTAYRFRRIARLPDGRIVQQAFFYPEQTMLRLFSKTSGVTLDAGRRVHERFVIPSDVSVIQHTEAFSHTWPSPADFRKKLDHYVTLEYGDMNGGLGSLLRWVIWYQLRSALGQSVRAVWVWIIGIIRREVVLPWNYTLPMIAYRFRVMGEGLQKWRK